MLLLDHEKKGIFLRASLSNQCNFNCIYCATDMGMENHTPPDIEAPLLTLDEYMKNMQLLSQHGFQNISFTGGEPMLCPFFQEIVEGCSALFETVEITTNGSMLKRYLKSVLEHIDVLKISLDSCDPLQRTLICGNKLAADTMNVIQACCEAGIATIGLNFVYMKQNKDQLDGLIAFAREMFRKYGTQVYISILDLYYSPGKDLFWRDQFQNLSELRKKLLQQGETLNHRLRFGCDSFNYRCKDVLINMKDSISSTYRIAQCDSCNYYCQEGVYSLKHSASGWISVCPNNQKECGTLLSPGMSELTAHEIIDHYIERINSAKKTEQSGILFGRKNDIEGFN